ncbi:MAG: hypothetical protein OHK0046_19830 [Anaerolineae bacterium]
MKRLFIVSGLLLVMLTLVLVPARAQVENLLTMTVDAGYDGWFRPNQWLPLRIELENRGDPINGFVVVRPETSGSALANTFSTPVELSTNSSQSLFLYMTARDNASVVRVELLNADRQVVTSREVNLRDMFSRDRLYVVVTQAATNIVDLSEISVGGYEAFQANWNTDNLPDRPGALDSVDAMLFTNVDTGSLSTAQQTALRQWVLRGGHLLVTGGAGWQATAAGLDALLPLTPQSSTTVDHLGNLPELAGDYDTSLTGDTIVTEGDLREDVRVLATTPDSTPLIMRRQYGNGVVDYLAVDPATQPLRDWEGLTELWFTLLSSRDARPAWTYGFSDWERAVSAVEILPGVDLLPAVLGLITFLVAYIALIGPLNYLILSRLNRREYAWVTIPILIVIFSVLAYSVGFEVRGNQTTLSRLSVVQTWPESDEARVDQLIGLLAPRRDDYTISMTDDRLLRPVSRTLVDPGALVGNAQASTDIQQSTRFEAVEFPVDASFIASFNTTGITTRPDIGGLLTLITNEDNPRLQSLQGSIRNDSDLTLRDPVILTRGTVTYLREPFEPGDIRTFNGQELALIGEPAPLPNPLEYAVGDANPFFVTTSFNFNRNRAIYGGTARNTARNILGEENYLAFDFNVSFNDDAATQETRRRQAFLDAFVIDQFGSTARGNRAYLIGWTEAAPAEEEISSGNVDTVDTTLYIIELQVEPEDNPPDDVLISIDQFSWISKTRTGVNDIGPVLLDIQTEGEVIFRFTPLPDAVLSEVEELSIIAQRNRSSWPDGLLSLWDWEAQTWVEQNFGPDEQAIIIDDPERFLGPQNAVEVRIMRTLEFLGSYPLQVLGVEQRGRF